MFDDKLSSFLISSHHNLFICFSLRPNRISCSPTQGLYWFIWRTSHSSHARCNNQLTEHPYQRFCLVHYLSSCLSFCRDSTNFLLLAHAMGKRHERYKSYRNDSHSVTCHRCCRSFLHITRRQLQNYLRHTF